MFKLICVGVTVCYAAVVTDRERDNLILSNGQTNHDLQRLKIAQGRRNLINHCHVQLYVFLSTKKSMFWRATPSARDLIIFELYPKYGKPRSTNPIYSTMSQSHGRCLTPYVFESHRKVRNVSTLKRPIAFLEQSEFGSEINSDFLSQDIETGSTNHQPSFLIKEFHRIPTWEPMNGAHQGFETIIKTPASDSVRWQCRDDIYSILSMILRLWELSLWLPAECGSKGCLSSSHLTN